MYRIVLFGIFLVIIGVVGAAVWLVILLVNVYDIDRWFLVFGMGLLSMTLAIYIERSRERLRAGVQKLNEMLKKWE